MKYQIERFDKPIIKSYKDVKKYDIALMEYGDYDNWIPAVILEVTPYKDNKELKITFETLYGDQLLEAFGFIKFGEHDFKIIGKAKVITKDQDIQK